MQPCGAARSDYRATLLIAALFDLKAARRRLLFGRRRSGATKQQQRYGHYRHHSKHENFLSDCEADYFVTLPPRVAMTIGCT